MREYAPSAPSARRGQGSHWPRLVLGAAAGLVLYLAFPPVGLWPAAPVGVALLALAVHGAPARRAALTGFAAGLGLFLPLITWTGAVAGSAAWVLLSVLEAAFFAPMAAALAATSRLRLWPVWGAAVWVGQEALRGRLPFGGFPWGRLAFSQDDSPLAPLAALGGAPLLTFALALLGGLLAAAVRRPPRRTLAGGLVAAVALVGLAVAVPTPTDGPTTNVAVIQGNVPRLGLNAFAQRAAVLTAHVDTTRQLAADVRAGRATRPDLVIWPENASDLDPFVDAGAYALIDGAVKDIGVPVLVGALVDGPGDKVSNTGIVWDPVSGPGERYVKQHPVPFGEYIPFRAQVRAVTDKVDLVPRDFAFGTRTGVLDVGPARIGDVICFEVAYDGLVRDAVDQGGRLIVVQTNNATFGFTAQTEQQLAMGRLRAIEHGRVLISAATSGVSAIVAPDGELVDRTDVFTRDVLQADVPLRDDLTLATRVGAWPELVLALVGLGAVLVVAGPALQDRRTARRVRR